MIFSFFSVRQVMANLRLGYACINTCLEGSVNRSCIARTFREKGLDYVLELAKSNLQQVLKVLEWNEYHGIRLYRMSSDMFPHLTNPQFIPSDDPKDYAYSLDLFDDLLTQIGSYAKKYHHRLTFHPGQFNQIGAQNPDVFRKTSRDLSAHAEILDRMGLDGNSVLVIHGGGAYGDKKKTMKRWVKQFFELPKHAQDRIVIENCERQYNYEDVLWLSKQVGRPVVFDTHHHACYSMLVTELPHPSTFMDKIIRSWTDLGLRPKFHISEQAPDKRVGAHSDYVQEIPDYLLSISIPIDIMIEAKAKEQATLVLYDTYFTFDDQNWCD